MPAKTVYRQPVRRKWGIGCLRLRGSVHFFLRTPWGVFQWDYRWIGNG